MVGIDCRPIDLEHFVWNLLHLLKQLIFASDHDAVFWVFCGNTNQWHTRQSVDVTSNMPMTIIKAYFAIHLKRKLGTFSSLNCKTIFAFTWHLYCVQSSKGWCSSAVDASAVLHGLIPLSYSFRQASWVLVRKDHFLCAHVNFVLQNNENEGERLNQYGGAQECFLKKFFMYLMNLLHKLK